ncbi:hypothetical protein AWZ03_013284 [Drosophila navojoa]|uniref:Uncharacterized protein n=1 Tax=Drosophila navojoa TaxID=7232 RepID=A0A484AWB1_DRONA|nr:hypothetical protein AWZ03_013284 [Drosophila navojoa]
MSDATLSAVSLHSGRNLSLSLGLRALCDSSHAHAHAHYSIIVVPWISLNSSLKWLVHCSNNGSSCSCGSRCVRRTVFFPLQLPLARGWQPVRYLAAPVSPSGCRECIHCTAGAQHGSALRQKNSARCTAECIRN